MVHQKIGDKLQVSTSQECNPEGSEKGKGKGKGKRGKGKQGGRCTKKGKASSKMGKKEEEWKCDSC